MSDARPTVHLTNWSSRKLFGPGRRLTIMVRPRRWEHGEGQCARLIPRDDDFLAAKSGEISLAEYRRRFEAYIQLHFNLLKPGVLDCWLEGRYRFDVVRDGDTLCCSCSKAAAAAGECHRAWSAAALLRAGWRVVLDGQELPPC